MSSALHFLESVVPKCIKEIKIVEITKILIEWLTKHHLNKITIKTIIVLLHIFQKKVIYQTDDLIIQLMMMENIW